MTNLLPCPFCNTTPILQHTPETGFYIHCPTCQSYTHGTEWSREEALAVWNNRPDPWVRIDPERPETLPEFVNTRIYVLAVHYPDGDYAIEGFRNGKQFVSAGGGTIDGVVYAYATRVLPTPPPYPHEEKR